VLESIGGYSWLAFIATMTLIPGKVSGDLIVNIAAFYQRLPKYECLQQDGSWANCTQEDFCEDMGGSSLTVYKEDQSDPETFQNWVQ